MKLAGFSRTAEGGYTVDSGAVTGGLFIEGGKLVYRYREGGAVKTSSVFALRVKSGTICPGDDFLLRFGLAENEDIVGTATAADYCAVYDKKLLWRANLYLDEGAGDWNNVNGWNSADNDWRVLKTAGADVDGGQIDIKPWSKWNGGDVSGHVAYGWGCWDSPSEFNTHMERQAALIADGRVNAGEADLFLGTVFAGLQWVANATTAPGGNWLNYVFPGRKKSTSGGHDYYDYSSEEANVKQHEYRANPNPRNIYVPGLSTFMAFGPADSPLRIELQNPNPDHSGVYHPGMVAYSSGADCSGFVCAAAGYPGNSYVMSRVNTALLADNAYSYLIADGTADFQTQPANLDKAVPGDILVRPDYHVVMVLSVTPNADGTVTRDGIRFIHMGEGENKEYQVLTNNTWATDQGLGGQWFEYQVRRLR